MKYLRPILFSLLLVGGFALLSPVMTMVFGADGAKAGKQEPSKEEKQRKLADAFFAGEIRRLKIEIAPDQVERLKKDERNYAEATLTESTPAGPRIYQKVAIKLKGSAGSFQRLDQKPGLTLNFDKLKGGDRFNGMKKIHLNNCLQDGTYLNEYICGEMARTVGVPASRCSHAFVELNGRDLGMYVVKEAFTKDFLSYFYKNTDGDLWDGGFVREIDESTEKDQGDPADKTAVRELTAACQEADPVKRWEKLGKILDIDKFVSFAAMEDILCHWDGYSFNRNNYRFYRDPDTGKISFFLHGMDQMFGDENFAVMRDFGSMVGNAVMRCPQGQEMYRARVTNIYTNVLLKEDWPAKVTAKGKQVQSAIATRDGRWAKEYENQINDARGKVTRRIAAIGRQLGAFKPIVFDANGVLPMAKGWAFDGNNGGRGDEMKFEGHDCLHLVVTESSAPSWRTTIQLPPGKYRLEALVRTRGAVATDDDRGRGAGVRISGGTKRANSAEGETAWKPVVYEFDAPGGDVVLVAELRATKGEAWFAVDSLRLVRGK